MLTASNPILSGKEAGVFEKTFFGGDEAKEWAAMQEAGRAVAAAVRRDSTEIGGLPAASRMLVLAGKGHNGGDALIAAQALLEADASARAEVVLVFGERALRPLAARAWRELAQAARDRVVVRSEPAGSYALCLDGVFGFQFRPPAEPRVAELFTRVNALPIRFRVAVDLPSAGLFQADFTYATGIVKEPLLGEWALAAGRVRYLDLGFFGGDEPGEARALTPAVLAPLAAWRAPQSDKRTYGHVYLLGGSRSYPGAILMSVLAALRSGAGLVTAFVPESLVPAFATRAPEAMWVGWPETPAGGLALEGQHLLTERLERARSLVIGPGLGREPETLALVRDIAATSPVPLVLDADALQPETVRAGKAPRVLTPHFGEFERLGGDEKLCRTIAKAGGAVVLKGPLTRIFGREEVYHAFCGGPVLARGGSGDVLAGLIGGLLAQAPRDPVLAAARGVMWHGLAADALARTHGPVSVQTTQLLDQLPAVLRDL